MVSAVVIWAERYSPTICRTAPGAGDQVNAIHHFQMMRLYWEPAAQATSLLVDEVEVELVGFLPCATLADLV